MSELQKKASKNDTFAAPSAVHLDQITEAAFKLAADDTFVPRARLVPWFSV
ncbi:MAG: hypothetical protein AAF670_00125 [Planctomycetota bacterium]